MPPAGKSHAGKRRSSHLHAVLVPPDWAIEPKVIVCLGACATQALLSTNKGISQFRGQWFDFRGAQLMATYHPAYLLRNPNAKPDVWADLKKVMAVLGLQAPRRKS